MSESKPIHPSQIDPILRPLARWAVDHGWTIFTRRTQHLRWIGPDGQLVFSSKSPGDVRAAQRVRRDLRRAGLSVPSLRDLS